MRKLVTRTSAIATIVLLSNSGAFAHCFVGGRFFPATLGIDDPCVADEHVAAHRRLFQDRR